MIIPSFILESFNFFLEDVWYSLSDDREYASLGN